MGKVAKQLGIGPESLRHWVAAQEGLPMKIDPVTGRIRAYDPVTNTFGAYSPAGGTIGRSDSSGVWSSRLALSDAHAARRFIWGVAA